MKSYEISSSQNKIFKTLSSLLTAKGIQKHGQALIFGTKSINELMKNETDKCVGIIVDKSMEMTIEGVTNQYVLTRELFERLDVFGTHEPILLVKIPPFEAFKSSEKMNGCSVVLPLQEPSNMGAVIRSSVAFGVKSVLLPPGAAHPFLPKSSRAAAGTLFQMKFQKLQSWADLKSSSQPTIGLDLKGDNLNEFDFPSDYFLVVGSEGSGLPTDFEPDRRILIPINPSVDSLNASVALSIALYKASE